MIVVQTLDELGKITDNSFRLYTSAELNLCGASWVPMLRLAGAEVSSHTPIKVGWVPMIGGGFHSTFKVTQTVEIILQVERFGWQDFT